MPGLAQAFGQNPSVKKDLMLSENISFQFLNLSFTIFYLCMSYIHLQYSF